MNSLKTKSKLKNAVAFALIITTVFAQEKSQLSGNSTEFNKEDISQRINKDMLSILVNGTVTALGQCNNAYNASLVQYWLFTKQSPNVPQIITSHTQIDFTKTTKILVHGWTGNADVDYIKLLKDAYVPKHDYNIISVDYSVYAQTDYVSAYCNTPIVGQIIAEFICNISQRIDPKSLHILGHSLGAQVAGVAGNETRLLCNRTIGRITGLDPAGPLFQGSDKPVRLDGDDALIVDVIHTNQGQLGYIGKCGTIDFYPNCGYQQPKCLSMTVKNITNPIDVFILPVEIMKCSHTMSCNLFAQSITDGHGFPSIPCLFCGLPVCLPKLTVTPLQVDMGEYYNPHQSEEKEFVVYV